jgi:transcriptional regulator with XRE-family HTH domain
MRQTAGGPGRLNWPELVAEAIRRRKAEKLTQKEHAALASVSVPTMIAFDRGERTLSLGKAMDILRVVGLLEEAPAGSAQDAFVQEAFARWRDLIKDLPKESPGRFPAGWYRVDYALEGDLAELPLHEFTGVLRQAVVPHTARPMFRVPRRPDLEAREADSVIECWLAAGDKAERRRPFFSADTCDFWRVAPSGRAVILRGYSEDAQETFPPGTIFDTTLPIWRIGEAFLHAARLARLIAHHPGEIMVTLRVLYTGLQGRDLRAWASPGAVFFGGARSRSDEAMLEGSATVSTIETNLAGPVLPLVSSLLARFGVTGTASSFVEVELARMRQNNFRE